MVKVSCDHRRTRMRISAMGQKRNFARCKTSKIVLHALCIPLIVLAWIGASFTAKILRALKTRLLLGLRVLRRIPSTLFPYPP